MNLDAISQFIIAAAPAITAVITALVSLIVGIKRIKNTSDKTIKEIKENSKDLRDENVYLRRAVRKVEQENAELKENLNEVLARMKHLYFVEKPDDKGE